MAVIIRVSKDGNVGQKRRIYFSVPLFNLLYLAVKNTFAGTDLAAACRNAQTFDRF
jgi:hypothetical protein